MPIVMPIVTSEARPAVPVWPAILEPAEFVLQLVPNSTSSMSSFTGAMGADALPGTSWQLSATFPSLDTEQKKAARAFIAQLRGCAGRFLFPAEPGGPAVEPQSPAGNLANINTGGVRVAGFTADGDLIATGWQAAAGDTVAREGDYISVDDANGWRRLLLLVEGAGVYGADQAVLVVEPRADTLNIPVGARLHIGNASGVFMLVDGEQGTLNETAEGANGFSISAVEFLCPNLEGSLT